MPPLNVSSSTGLTITNPLVLYRALLATKQIDPDPSQHRLALHLQKLYFRLKDYSPQTEYGEQLKAISDVVSSENESRDGNPTVAVRGHPLRRNPLFSHLFSQKGRRDTLALTRVLTSHEAAMSLDSPRGLLLHGEVGTGKSMLVDLLANSLPNRRKRRWHFNTFMLETLSKLESLRQSRLATGNLDTEYSLLWLAKDMIEKSPILFLDEFQLPDRAASKILSNLLTTFFQLGGVLIASSNRMPDELAKASGVEYAPPPKGGLVRKWLGLGAHLGKGDMFAGSGEFSNFLDVLKARCEVWDMDGGKDWRRRESEMTALDEDADVERKREKMIEGFSGLESMVAGDLGHGYEQSLDNDENTGTKLDPNKLNKGRLQSMKAIAPVKYILSGIDAEETWNAALRSAVPANSSSPIPWTSTTFLVYGRRVFVQCQYEGVSLWDFSTLCGGAFGPADYITLASTFHTIILDDVPILTLLQKNEARRLITLLDALYEARCKLIIRASVGPDSLFFPEASQPPSTTSSLSPDSDATNHPTLTRPVNDGNDAVYPETLSEIYQDQTSPFRPNVSAYNPSNPTEDSDFGPIPGQGNEIGRQVDFGNTSSFTGEDERFAYKRARSRLWEMCGARWHARSDPGWWRPIPLEVRRWERSLSGSVPFDPMAEQDIDHRRIQGDVKIGQSVELDKPAGLQGKELQEAEEREKMAITKRAKSGGEGSGIPFREKREPPRKIEGWHAWGITTWGKRAGAWGRGVEGLKERDKGGTGGDGGKS